MEILQPLEKYGNFTTTGKVLNFYNHWNSMEFLQPLEQYGIFTTTGTVWNFYGDDNK
jgi:hypothetical protein